ncbi:MAG: DUF4860 domain-containing protein [Lachnospiraceae bacterium]|nr:DUF4860 domain-containing protein [Lachnospiraceae bacterium]
MGSEKKTKNYIVDFFFTLALFGAFAISSIMVVYFGAKVYESVTDGMNRNFTARTAVSYITEKLRQRDSEGTADITSIDGVNAITLIKKTGDNLETTYIFSDDGYLKEVTIKGDEKPTIEDGNPIMELYSFNVKEVAEGIYYVIIVDRDGNTDRAYVSTKCDPKIKGQATAAPDPFAR